MLEGASCGTKHKKSPSLLKGFVFVYRLSFDIYCLYATHQYGQTWRGFQ